MTLGQLHGRRRCVDVGPEVLRLLQRGIIGGRLEAQRRVRVIEHLLRDELTLVQLGCAREGLLGLGQFGAGSPHVGRVFDAWQLFPIGGTVLCQCARMRRALLVEAVLQLLAIQLDQCLSSRDAITEIGPDPTNHAVDFRGDRDLVFGRQRSDDIEACGAPTPDEPLQS